MMKKKIISIEMALALLCIVFCTACGAASEGNGGNGTGDLSIEGDLQDVMAEIYAGIQLEDAEAKEAMQGYVIDTLNKDNEQAFLGIEGIAYTEGVYSVPMISSIAYQCVLLRVSPDDVDTVKEQLEENADLNKWICVSAETALVENVGDVVLFVMCQKDVAYAISESFHALGK